MFKRGRGGFASYTKTGRNIALGRSLGESLARGTRSRGSSSSSEELGTCGYILYIILILLLIDQITKATNKYQAQ
jgi:hypothetical protein